MEYKKSKSRKENYLRMAESCQRAGKQFWARAIEFEEKGNTVEAEKHKNMARKQFGFEKDNRKKAEECKE